MKPKSDEEFFEEMKSSNEFTEDYVQRCLVYDKRTGKIIHTHEYVPLSSNKLLSNQDLEKTAIRHVPLTSKYDMESLGTFHPKQADRDLLIKRVDLDPTMRYKIDLESHSLIVEHLDIDTL